MKSLRKILVAAAALAPPLPRLTLAPAPALLEATTAPAADPTATSSSSNGSDATTLAAAYGCEVRAGYRNVSMISRRDARCARGLFKRKRAHVRRLQ